MITCRQCYIFNQNLKCKKGEKLADVCGFINPVTKRTGPFEVTVRVAFLYNESSIIPPHFHYGYEITQRMDKSGLEFQGTGFLIHFNLGDSKESMRLERRYWKIDSLNDHIDEVDGPGKTSKRLDLFHFRWFNIAL